MVGVETTIVSLELASQCQPLCSYGTYVRTTGPLIVGRAQQYWLVTQLGKYWAQQYWLVTGCL